MRGPAGGLSNGIQAVGNLKEFVSVNAHDVQYGDVEVEQAKKEMSSLAGKVARRMHGQGIRGRTVSLKVKYETGPHHR